MALRLRERIRAEHAKNILLVALTGWGQQADKERALSADFDHHLTKPLDADTLRKVLSL